MSEVAVTEALGEWLSPSQVTTYLSCPAKWYFRYLIGLIEPATGCGRTWQSVPPGTGPKLPTEDEYGLRYGRR